MSPLIHMGCKLTDSTAKQIAVNAYVNAGLALFNCGRGPTKKAPWKKDWKETPWDFDLTADDLADIYGVVLTDEIVVLDYDIKRDPEHGTEDSQLKRMWRELGLPKNTTFTVKTGGGGYHFYFKKPKEDYYRGSIKEYPAFDIKTLGGFVIGSGSSHESGNCYKTICGDVANLSDIPGALSSRIRIIPGERATGDVIETDDLGTRNRFIRYCGSCEPAIENAGGDDRTYITACEGKNYGLSESAVFDIMAEHFNPRCSPAWDDAELSSKVRNAFAYSEAGQGTKNPEYVFEQTSTNAVKIPFTGDNNDNRPMSLADAANAQLLWTFNHNKQGEKVLEPTLNNALAYLRLAPSSDSQNDLYKLFRYNQFAGQIEFTRPAPWHDPDYPTQFITDYDVLKIKEWFTTRNLSLYVSTELVREALTIASHDNAYHPIRDWLRSLKWDGVPRLDDMLITYASSPSTDYVREVSKNTLIAAVARVLKPGCKHDSMLILEGPQDTGKSAFIRVLGGEWYADIIIDPKDTDTVGGLQGGWIFEASEMEVLKRAEVSALKRFLTLLIDKVRLPYARFHSILPRQSIFIGTINPGASGYFVDETGNRRFWPVVTGELDLDGLQRDREQLFAEAVSRYNGGEPWHITDGRIKALATGEQNSRMVRDSWLEFIEAFLNGGNIPDELTTENVALYALSLSKSKVGRIESDRIHKAMRACGYEKIQSKRKGRTIRVWAKDQEVV